MPATLYAHDIDPRQKLLDAVGDLDGIEVWHNQVICAIYVAPERTKGGIIRPQSNVDEDRYQGKVGLIIKMGPQAFRSDAKWQWPDDLAEQDWVYYRASDGFACRINGVDCRILEDVDVKGRAQHPDKVW